MRYYSISVKCGHCLIGEFTVTIPSEELSARGRQIPLKCTACGNALEIKFLGEKK